MALNGDAHLSFSRVLRVDGEGSTAYDDHAPGGECEGVQRAAGEGVGVDDEEEAVEQEWADAEVAVGRGEGPA